MKAFAFQRCVESRHAQLVTLCVLPLFLLSLCGCGEVEGTNTTTAACTLNPSATFPVVQDPPSGITNIITTNVVNGITNTTTTTEGFPSISSLRLTATTAGVSSWNVQADDDTGGTYSGTATGPSLQEPSAGNTYPAGTTVATFALQCSGLSGEISAVALVNIPMNVVRTSTTNGTNVVVGRIGQHTLTPQNTEYKLTATITASTGTYTLSGRAPIAPATIDW